jgi:LysR family transcriptional regulator, glycine cleavage system transcriptional activator
MSQHRLPPLLALRAFAAVGRHLSFARAAIELSVTQSAISHHIRNLESDLGVKLFVRRTRAIDLTAEGERFLSVVSDAFARIEEGTRLLRKPDRVSLRVSLLASFATHWLVPRLPRFAAAHPQIDLILDPSIRLVDFQADGADLAIRYGQGGWSGVDATRLMTEYLSPVCSPRLLERDAPLRVPADLLGFPLLLSYSKQPFEWLAWSNANGINLAHARRVMLTDYNIVLQAAIDGQGIALGRRLLIGELLRNGKLVEPFPDTVVFSDIGYWLVAPRAALSAPAAAFAQWISAEAADAQAHAIDP